MRRVAAWLSIAAASMAVAACEPCAGVVACTSGPRVSIEGTLVEHIGGAPVPHTRVSIIRTGGVGLANDSIATTIDEHGHWQISVAASSAGDAIVDILVEAPGWAPYRVVGQRFSTTDRLGDGHILEPWVVDPRFAYAAELHYHTLDDERLVGVAVEFRRTGGVGFYNNAGGDVYRATTDDAGRVVLFDIFAHATGVGVVVGDLIVHLPSPFAPDTVHGIQLTSTPLLHPATQILRLGAGPSLLYVVELHRRRDGAPVANAAITFQRTSGASIRTPTYSTTSDAGGRFLLPFVAQSNGSVSGDLSVTSPLVPAGTVIKGFTLKPHHDENARFFGVVGVGPYLPWVGYLAIKGRGAVGVKVDVHRTGGIQVDPADYQSTTNADGYFALNPRPFDVGNVELDILVHSPPPFAEFRTHLSVPTVQDDVTGGIFYGHDIDGPPGAPTAAPASLRGPVPLDKLPRVDPRSLTDRNR